jgi:hypothetical protein
MSKDEQEQRTTEGRTEILKEFFREALEVFQENNKGNLPE